MSHTDSDLDIETPFDEDIIIKKNLFSKTYIDGMPKATTGTEARTTRSEATDVAYNGTSRTKIKTIIATPRRAEADAASDAEDDAEPHVDMADLVESCMKIYALTVNLCPSSRFTNKLWKKYDHQNQVAILIRLHNKAVKNTSIITEKIYFEVCPDIKQMHFHAKIKCLPDHMNDYAISYEKYLPKTVMKDPSKSWRTVRFDELNSDRDIEQWDKYITKDQ